MRILLVPELYRPEDVSSNGTLNDAVTWVQEWLRRDDSMHVYWLMPPRSVAGYDAEYVLADRERVTLIEAEPFACRSGEQSLFTEHGYTPEQLNALEAEIFEPTSYVDVVIDQLRTGRRTLYKWLLEHTDQWAARVKPFDVIANVHDLQMPSKYRYCSYRNEYQMRMEICGAVFADGIWFKAGTDAREMRVQAKRFLRPTAVDAALDAAVETGSPIDFGAFEETYRDEPRWLHVAGSLWEKKHAERVLAVAETLFERFDIRTVMTSMEDIPAEYAAPEWVDAFPEASRETFERALRRGDLAVCASEYETMARTPFEQAASGQVLVLRDEPWVYDCVPEKHPLVVDADELAERTRWAVTHWDEAVAANRALVEHVRRVRSPKRAGRRTYQDLARRVEEKTERYAASSPPERVLSNLDEPAIALDELVERTAVAADDGRPGRGREYALIDLVYALRSSGYEDAGNPGTPVFRRTPER